MSMESTSAVKKPSIAYNIPAMEPRIQFAKTRPEGK